MTGGKCHVLVMAGGTGGHVFPALAVAQELRERGCRVSWLGTAQGIEANLVPTAGLELHTLPIAGLRKRGFIDWLWLPWRLGISLWAALFLLVRMRPSVVIGFGGYAAGPGGLMAAALGRPLLIHEQNAIAGMTNRWLAKVADRVFAAFPNAFAESIPVSTIGNPVRATIMAVAEPSARYADRAGALRLLVLGGSLGALRLNETLPLALAQIEPADRPEVIHQAGRQTLKVAEQGYRDCGVSAEVTAFIDDMAAAYAWADLIICRSGALTVSEIAACGAAAVLIPYPFAVDDHQRANAEFLVRNDAAWMVRQDDFTAAWLAGFLRDMNRERLLAVARRARALGRVDAVQVLADACIETSRSDGRAAK
jgi:UDP-N-acetylglucosamine--N-acetylmuramyl-(pentapeptide) pyrophosphoryl-undecaprenol N-acetylglucosamine transferase